MKLTKVEKVRIWRLKNPDKLKEQRARYRAKHKTQIALKRAANCETAKLYHKKWRLENLEKERENRQAWRTANREWHLVRQKYLAAKRRANKIKATPKWVDVETLLQIYQNCPNTHEVDHIIPLQGKEVRGLHVPWNLQYLTPKDNQSKGNRVSG